MGIHSHQARRYSCPACQRTFAETTGTLWDGLTPPVWRVVTGWTVLADGCPVQADELYVKTQRGRVWMATALSVCSRLFMWGAVAAQREMGLMAQVIQRVRAAAQRGQPIWFAVDGLAASPQAILKVFREAVHLGRRGRPRLVVWADWHIVQVVKHHRRKRLTDIRRRRVPGCWQRAHAIRPATQVRLGVVNTAYVERRNATLRAWVPALVRRTRTPARQVAHLDAALFWTGCVDNFCHVHRRLQGTPALAADLTDHVWSVEELRRHPCT